jgi:hypothetical protein
MAMVAIGMNPMPPKLLGERFLYVLEVFLGCQRILNPRGIQTFEGGKSQKK